MTNENKYFNLQYCQIALGAGHVEQVANMSRYADMEREFIDDHFIRFTAVDETWRIYYFKNSTSPVDGRIP
jgi:hypothetical protein